jgi:phosphoglycolate phosphatase-like HAD superfamily hydrolase
VKLYVWDLHGVLEVGNDRAAVDVSNTVLARFGYTERFTYEDGVRLYGRPWYEYFEFLLPHLAYEQHIDLQEASFKLSEACPQFQYRKMRPTPHIEMVLETIGKRHQQIVISNTKPASLRMYLNLLKIERFFPDGRAIAVDLHLRSAKTSKRDVLEKYLATQVAFEEIIIIGDSASDMQLAEVAGGVTYLFAHPGFEFRDCESDFRIRDLRCVLERV